jgi:type IV secretory pathway component VirB8
MGAAEQEFEELGPGEIRAPRDQDLCAEQLAIARDARDAAWFAARAADTANSKATIAIVIAIISVIITVVLAIVPYLLKN